MADVSISLDRNFKRFADAIERTAEKAHFEMMRGLQKGGNKVRTEVRRALVAQTSAKYGAVTSSTRSYIETVDLSFTIASKGSGLPIRAFPFRFSRSKGMLVRWDKHEHWRLQRRDGHGRWGELVDNTDGKGVSATMWGSSHAFKRSFAHPTKGPVMQREAGKRGLRQLFGPSIPKELTTDRSAATFEKSARTIIQSEIEKRLERLLP